MLIQAFIRSIIWTSINIGAIQVVKHGDSSGWNEPLLVLLMVPVGLINCAVCIHAFYRLRKPSKEQLIYSFFGIGNAAYFFFTWNHLQNLTGAMTS